MNVILQTYLEANLYCTISTTNSAAEPWASPLFFAHDDKGNLYIRSSKGTRHMKNMRDNPQAFVVLFDSRQPIGTADGLYLQCEAEELNDKTDIAKVVPIMDAKSGAQSTDIQRFMGEGPKRIVRLRPKRAWTNSIQVTDAGYMDYREEVPLV